MTAAAAATAATSGDPGPRAAEREYEDLAAVAAATGTGAPFVFGHSSGAAIALRAAAAGLPVAGIVAYEAPFGNDEHAGAGRRPGRAHPRSWSAPAATATPSRSG